VRCAGRHSGSSGDWKSMRGLTERSRNPRRKLTRTRMISRLIKGSIFSDFFSFRISSGDGELCPGCFFIFFLQLYCLAWFVVCALKTDFFSNLGSLSGSGCEDFAERKKVNLRYFL
jgi:hypothetical protein